MKKALLTLAVVIGLASGAQAQLVITQYYEGTSNNKWIELTNVGGSVIADLSIYKLSLWQNANTEAYKTDGTPNQTLTLSGSLDAGSSFLLSHGSAVLPSYAVADLTSSTVINFNGDDSLTLWSGVTFTTASIIDAIGFTDLGNEGADTSFVRLIATTGWNTTLGSTVLDFPSVWSSATLTEVADAAALTDPRLGFSSVTAVPEPSTCALAMAGLLLTVVVMRRRSRRA